MKLNQANPEVKNPETIQPRIAFTKTNIKTKEVKGKDTYLIVVRVIMLGVRGKRRGRTKAKDRGEVTEDCDSEEGEEEGSFGSCVSIPRHYYC